MTVQVNWGVSRQRTLFDMSDRRLALLLAFLTILSGTALYRLIGPVAGGGTLAALSALFSTYRARRARLRHELLAELRAQSAADRASGLDAVPDLALRAQLATDLVQEGSVEYEGDITRFPFPASFQRWATRRYWNSWLLSTAFLALAAAFPNLSNPWRSFWLVLGLLSATRVWRASQMQSALATILEVGPFSVSEVWPNGGRRTVVIGRHASLMTDSDGNLTLTNTASGVAINISKYRLAFADLATLLNARMASSSSVAAR
jgi:hypothetical protein